MTGSISRWITAYRKAWQYSRKRRTRVLSALFLAAATWALLEKALDGNLDDVESDE